MLAAVLAASALAAVRLQAAADRLVISQNGTSYGATFHLKGVTSTPELLRRHGTESVLHILESHNANALRLSFSHKDVLARGAASLMPIVSAAADRGLLVLLAAQPAGEADVRADARASWTALAAAYCQEHTPA